MIKITIEQTIADTYETMKNVVTKETPTDKTEGSDYTKKVLFDREFALKPVRETNSRRVTLLVQEIEDESKFDLTSVIKAVNSMVDQGKQ